MSIEQLSPSSISEIRPPLREGIDFAQIRNPLGHTALLNGRSSELIVTTEERLALELAALWSIQPDQITVGHGSTDIIEQIPGLFLEPGAKAVLPVPTYFGLLNSVSDERIVPVPVPAQYGFTHTPEYLEELLGTIRNVRPGVVWLCSPNNPTGEVIPEEHIRRIAETTNGLVIVDEAYQELVDPTNQSSAIHLVGRFSNIIVTKTFSKAYGLPDIHIGMAIATPQVTHLLRRNRMRLPNPESLAKASIALTDQKHIVRSYELMVQETQFVWNQIRQMEHIQMGAKSRSGVCIVRHSTGNLFELLRQCGMKTLDFNTQRGLEGQRFVRLGLQNRDRNNELIAALKQCDVSES